jgi:hypothetical protein
MCPPFHNLFVRYDSLLRGWCVAYVGDVSVSVSEQCLVMFMLIMTPL